MKTISLMLFLITCTISSASAAPVLTESPASALDLALKRAHMRRNPAAIESTRALGGDLVEITRADGSREVQPLRYIVQPAAARAVGDVAAARVRLETAALTAANLTATADPAARAAALNALAERTAEPDNSRAILAAVALASAAAGTAIGRSTATPKNKGQE